MTIELTAEQAMALDIVRKKLGTMSSEFFIQRDVSIFAAGIAHERARCIAKCKSEARNWSTAGTGRQACLNCAEKLGERGGA